MGANIKRSLFQRLTEMDNRETERERFWTYFWVVALTIYVIIEVWKGIERIVNELQ